jgi:hypothetical protein
MAVKRQTHSDVRVVSCKHRSKHCYRSLSMNYMHMSLGCCSTSTFCGNLLLCVCASASNIHAHVFVRVDQVAAWKCGLWMKSLIHRERERKIAEKYQHEADEKIVIIFQAYRSFLRVVWYRLDVKLFSPLRISRNISLHAFWSKFY